MIRAISIFNLFPRNSPWSRDWDCRIRNGGAVSNPMPSRPPPGFSWPTTRHVTENHFTRRHETLRFQIFHHHQPRGRLRFLSLFPGYLSTRRKRAKKSGVSWELAVLSGRSQPNDRDIRPPAALFISTFRLRATMSDTSAEWMVFYRPKPFYLSYQSFSFGFDIPEVGTGR